MRWIPLLAISLLLHALLLATADGWIAMPAAAPAATRVMTAVLTAPPARAVATQPAPTPPAAAPKPLRPRRRPRTPPVTAVPSAAEVVPPAAEVAPPAPAVVAEQAPTPIASDAAGGNTGVSMETDRSPATSGAVAETPENASVAPPPPGPAPAGSPSPPDAPATPHYRVSAPPSATLAFEVRYSTRGNVTRGSSVIEWRLADGGYAIHGEVTKFGFALSSFRSEGTIDAAGIAPALYTEKNARRSETNTRFLRDARQAISFSASADRFPLTAGAQDRGSILWQLSGIGRADPALFAPGAVLDILVAGVRDAERWRIDIVGEEPVTLENGATRAWHLVRAPRAGTSDKRIDIWLAPAQEWYPVKLRYTEPGGDYLDLSLSAVR